MAISFPRTLTLIVEMTAPGTLTLALEEFNLGTGTVTNKVVTSKAVRIIGPASNDGEDDATQAQPSVSSHVQLVRINDGRP